jgi:hypothetical protein
MQIDGRLPMELPGLGSGRTAPLDMRLLRDEAQKVWGNGYSR